MKKKFIRLACGLDIGKDKFRACFGQYSKTDKLDAKGICQMACERKFKLWKPSSPNILTLITALRHRKSLINKKIRLTNQLHTMDHSAYTNKQIKSSINRLTKQIDREIEKMENLCIVLYEADEVLYKKQDLFISFT